MVNTILLKKYTNRRLYDTEKSRYVTLEEVAGMVRQGTPVKIVDAKTQEDVTAFILTQIITEEAKKKNILMPVPVLHLIIRYGDNLLGDFMDNYLQQAIQNYLKYKKAFDDQMKKWLEMGMDLTVMLPKPPPGTVPFGNLFDLFNYGGPSATAEEKAPAPPGDPSPTKDENQEH